MDATEIHTAAAPAAIGPYSQAVRLGDLIFISGQTPLVPETGELVSQDIAEQTRQVLANIKAIVEAAGSSMDRVVKTTVLLMDMADFAAMNAVYAEAFPGAVKPARATFQVAGLPKAARVEIEAIAH